MDRLRDNQGVARYGDLSFRACVARADRKVLGNAMTGFDWRRVEGEVTLPTNAVHAAVVLMINGTGTAWLDDVSADESDPGKDAQPKPQGPPKPKNSCDPAEGFYPDYPNAWRQVFRNQLSRAKEGNAPLVFIGDSLTQGWPVKRIEPRPALPMIGSGSSSGGRMRQRRRGVPASPWTEGVESQVFGTKTGCACTSPPNRLAADGCDGTTNGLVVCSLGASPKSVSSF